MTLAPDNLDDIRRDLGRGLAYIEKHHDSYVERQEYYEGSRAEVTASAAIKRILRASAQAHPLSFAHVPVDALMDMIELSAWKADGNADALLQTVYDTADIEDEADDWHTKAGYFGDYYVIIDPEEESADGNAMSWCLAGSSPLTTVVLYDKSDDRTPLYGVKRWQTGDEWHASVFYDDMTISLEAEESKTNEVPEADRFEYDVDDEAPAGDVSSARIAHKGGKMLIVHLAVDGKPYGRPLHRKAFGPQDAITKISATNLSNVDGQGFASRWALLDPLAEIDDDIDDDFGDASPSTAPNSPSDDGLTMATAGTGGRVRTIPGAIALLRGIKQVGQFDATETDQFLKNLDWYVRAMAVATRVPMFEFDPESGAALSGEARRRAKESLTQHARKVQRTLSRAHVEICDTLLGTAGITATVTVTFRPTETTTDKDGFDLIAQKIKVGVPIVQAFNEAGYTTEQTTEWFPDGEPNVNYDTLQLLAMALRELGQAKTLGAISDADLRALLPTVLTTAIAEGPPAPAPGLSGLGLPSLLPAAPPAPAVP